MPTKLEYIWIDGSRPWGIRSKIKVITGDFDPDIHEVPIWNFDGSSTNQAVGDDSDCVLQPIRCYPHPYTDGHDSWIVFCEVMTSEGNVHETNTRSEFMKAFMNNSNSEPWFGFEQEYSIIHNNRPLGFPDNGFPSPQGIYYCGVGGDIAVGQECANDIFQNAIKSDLNVTELSGGVAPSQWTIKLGGDVKVKLLDDLICLRYIIAKTSEKYGVTICFHPQLLKEEWNGSGCVIEYSNERMRQDKECNYIRNTVIKNLDKAHAEYVSKCGEDNNRRLLGTNNTSKHEEFTSGVGKYDCSVRIPKLTNENGYGSIEDRRPGANIDPYVVIPHLLNSSFQ